MDKNVGMEEFRSEIFLGLVAPVGIDIDTIESLIKDNLSQYKYKTNTIRLSQLIQNIRKIKKKIIKKPEFKRIDTSMTAGNEARRITRQNDILARLSIVKIQESRGSKEPKQENAYIFRSIKHPEEAKILGLVYEKGFFLLGFSSSREKKLEYLIKRKRMSEEQAECLIKRDEAEPEEFGQHTRDVFYTSDVFFDVDSKRFKQDLHRFFDLIFGDPYITPTKDEFGMFLAFASSFRSGDLSRQVGAVISSENGEFIATGCNDVPKKGGGLYWCDDTKDERDFKIGYDSNEKRKNEIAIKIVSQFIKRNVTEKELARIAKDKLKDTGFFDITEYGRAVHAEMEALLSCARSGISPRAGTLYTSTFPCHNCAKHIVDCGIIRVVFIEPYPKSKALDLHKDSIIVDTIYSKEQNKVVFQPFIGVGPRRFIDFFSLRLSDGLNIKREKYGIILKKSEKLMKFRFPLLPMSYLERELSIGAVIHKGGVNGKKKRQ